MTTKEMTIQKFLLELLKLSGMNQTQMAEAIGITQGSLSNLIKTANPNMNIIYTICKDVLTTGLFFQLEGKSERWLNYLINGSEICDKKQMTLKETAEAMGVKPSTLRSRISRRSCTVDQLKQHLEAVGEELIFIVNKIKYKIK